MLLENITYCNNNFTSDLDLQNCYIGDIPPRYTDPWIPTNPWNPGFPKIQPVYIPPCPTTITTGYLHLSKLQPPEYSSYYDKKQNFIVEFDLPALDRDSLEIDIGDGQISVSGKTTRGPNSGEFVHVIDLSCTPNTIKAKADYKDGVLTLTIPQYNETKRRSIKLPSQK